MIRRIVMYSIVPFASVATRRAVLNRNPDELIPNISWSRKWVKLSRKSFSLGYQLKAECKTDTKIAHTLTSSVFSPLQA